MRIKIKYRRSSLVLISMISIVFLLTMCVSNEKKDKTTSKTEEAPITFESYTTAEKCAGCHKEIHDHHFNTTHYLTGQPAEKKFIKGSFEKGRNEYSYTPSILLSMQKRDSGYY